MAYSARDRLSTLIGRIDPQDTDRILDVVFAETVAGATVNEMSHAMGRIRAERADPTYPAVGEHIWNIRYERAGEEEGRYMSEFGMDTRGNTDE